jgi:hydroxymethylpyrimidine kinase/phosphomethylpyrimidine kinase/thiamine-phosphate diphosphorylase
MTTPAIAWAISGIDPAGLAGTLLDLETLKNFAVNSCAIITAVTAQNAQEVTAIEAVSSEHVAAQCEALRLTFKPQAIKIGMLGSPNTAEKLIHFLQNYSGYVVLDPVLASSSGTPLFFADLEQHLANLLKLFPHADLVTPNVFEAEHIVNRSLTSHQDLENAANDILSLGVKSVLMKGGHTKEHLFSQDYWTNGQEAFWISNQRAQEGNYRGTGCMLSSAITACLALGYSIKDAIVIAKMYVNRGIRKAFFFDKYTAKPFQGSWPEEEVDLPYLSLKPLLKFPPAFKPYQTGLYPVVDSSKWVEKLLPQGVKCIQLRIKNAPKKYLKEEIKRSVSLAQQHKATLFINDYWELAIRYGAHGVHLGQEDLLRADINQIYQAGLYLGLSTHCYHEVARAHALNPSYIACGPIYATTSKVMPFQPQGLNQLRRWRRTLRYPLVAIGGINPARLPPILQMGIDGVALISAITNASDPIQATHQLLAQMQE